MHSPTDTARRVAETVKAAIDETPGLTQADAALALGVSVATFERRLTGLYKPFNVPELEIIAKLTGSTVTGIVARAEGVAA